MLVLCLFTLLGKWKFISLFDERKVSNYKSLIVPKHINKDISPWNISSDDEFTTTIYCSEESINGYYKIDNGRFLPDLDIDSAWYISDDRFEPHEWDNFVSGEMRKIKNIEIKVKVPDVIDLEGKTIKGTIILDILYPSKLDERGFFGGKFDNRRTELISPLTFYIFPKGDSEEIVKCRQWANKIWFPFLIIFLTIASMAFSGCLVFNDDDIALFDLAERILIPASIAITLYLFYFFWRFIIHLHINREFLKFILYVASGLFTLVVGIIALIKINIILLFLIGKMFNNNFWIEVRKKDVSS